MELQAESERIKRSKILTSEGERESKINIAEGIKQAAILEGQGAASKILQEARGICESLERISSAIDSEEGGKGQDALRLKLTEQYIEALNDILSHAKVLMIPAESGNAGGEWNNQKIATSLTLFKSILGAGGPAMLQAGRPQPDLLSEVQKKISQLEQISSSGGNKSSNQTKSTPRYQYHDDKALY